MKIVINQFGTPINPPAFSEKDRIDFYTKLSSIFDDSYISDFDFNENGFFIILYYEKNNITKSIELTSSKLEFPFPTGINNNNIDSIVYNVILWNKEDVCSEKHFMTLSLENALNNFELILNNEISIFKNLEYLIEEK